MILDQATLIPPALNGVNAIFQVAVIRAGVKLGPAELRPIRYSGAFGEVKFKILRQPC